MAIGAWLCPDLLKSVCPLAYNLHPLVCSSYTPQGPTVVYAVGALFFSSTPAVSKWDEQAMVHPRKLAYCEGDQ